MSNRVNNLGCQFFGARTPFLRSRLKELRTVAYRKHDTSRSTILISGSVIAHSVFRAAHASRCIGYHNIVRRRLPVHNGRRAYTHTVGPCDNYHNNTAYLEIAALSLSLSLSHFPSGLYHGYLSGRHAFNRNTHPIGGPYVRTSVPFRSRIVMLIADNANPITPSG